MSRDDRRAVPRALWRAGVVAVAATMVFAASAHATTGTSLLYQCPDGTHICSVAPEGGAPVQPAQTGTLAGVTRDGTTYGYASDGPGSSTLWQAPVTGGAPVEVSTEAVDVGADTPDPVMSADGRFFLEHQERVGEGFQPDSDTVYEFSVAAGPAATPTVVAASTAFGLTYGWLGDTTMVSFASEVGLQPPTWICVGFVPPDPDDTFCESTDPTARVQSQVANLAEPDGSPSGQTIVAVVAEPGQTGGSIALFAAATGAELSTVATPPAGELYSDPSFSPDGSEVVLQADPTGGGQSEIETVPVTGGTPKAVTPGTDPFWGSAGPTPPGGPGPTPPGGTGGPQKAPRPRLTIARQSLGTLRRTGRLTVTCSLPAAGRCSVRVTVTAREARRVGIKIAKGRRSATLASAARTLPRAGSRRLRLLPSTAVLHALRRVRRLPLTVIATSTAAGLVPQRAIKSLTLR